MPIKDLKGQVFGKLTVMYLTNEKNGTNVVWMCQCSCKNKTLKKVNSGNLRSGNIQSCGCLHGDVVRKHGACKTSSKEGQTQLDYVIWRKIKERCYNVNAPNYKDYGGRGISMSKKWKDSFIAFAAYIRRLENCPSDEVLTSRLKGKRIKVSIDRINNDKDYKPSNIKWSTPKEQNNNSRKNIIVEYKGKKMTLAQAAEKYGKVSYKTVHLRYRKQGWSIQRALETISCK